MNIQRRPDPSSSELHQSNNPLLMFDRNATGSDVSAASHSSIGIAITCLVVFLKLLLIVTLLGLFSGCATSHGKQNKNIFEQALILQQVAPDNRAKTKRTERSNQSNLSISTNSSATTLRWSFVQGNVLLSPAQINELYAWLSGIGQLDGALLLLKQGPDWLSSIKRGEHIRQYIPRGLKVRQIYQATMPAHQVQLQLQAPESRNHNQKGEASITNGLNSEQLMSLIRQGGRYDN